MSSLEMNSTFFESHHCPFVQYILTSSNEKKQIWTIGRRARLTIIGTLMTINLSRKICNELTRCHILQTLPSKLHSSVHDRNTNIQPSTRPDNVSLNYHHRYSETWKWERSNDDVLTTQTTEDEKSLTIYFQHRKFNREKNKDDSSKVTS